MMEDLFGKDSAQKNQDIYVPVIKKKSKNFHEEA
jgi:hypothetical protein